MRVSKDEVTAAISEARAQLDEALEKLEYLPAFDASTIGFVAHALNNYLTIIGGSIDLLLGALENSPNPDVHIWLKGMRRGTDIMAHTVNQLMNMSAGGNPPLTWENVDVSVLVQRLCDYYQRLANRKRISISRESTADHLFAWTDRMVLAAVMDNLLSNAVKYSQHGQQIDVQVAGQPNEVICSVRDRGPGLTTEDKAKLFQRGVRLSAVPTGGEPSTGYGLAVAKELMGLLHGAIWCESTPGQGACFSIRFPIHRTDEASGQGGIQGPHHGSAGPNSTNGGG